MKENETLKKIYLSKNPISNEPDDRWLSIRSCDEDVEYTCTDAFIEKACDAYCEVCGHYHHTVPYQICRHDCRYYDDFKKLLKEK